MELVSSTGQYVIRFNQATDKRGKPVNCVNFEIVEPGLVDAVVDYEPVATGTFGYDGCIHFRAKYHHYCFADHIIEVANLLKDAQQVLLTDGLDTYKAVR